MEHAAACTGEIQSHPGMVGTEVFGDGALAVNQEGVPTALLGQGCLVSLCHKAVQLTLLCAHHLHILKGRENSPEVVSA